MRQAPSMKPRLIFVHELERHTHFKSFELTKTPRNTSLSLIYDEYAALFFVGTISVWGKTGSRMYINCMFTLYIAIKYDITLIFSDNIKPHEVCSLAMHTFLLAIGFQCSGGAVKMSLNMTRYIDIILHARNKKLLFDDIL